MATSKLKIYQTVLTPAKNALVDDLDAYLATLTPTYVDETFQYQKLDLDLRLKINLGQAAITNQSLGNYLTIEQDGKKWYYFIISTDWKAVSTVEVSISVDSINTFRNDFTFLDRTNVIREHRDRYRINAARDGFKNKIDPIPEGIEAAVYGKDEGVIYDSDNQDKTEAWYLIYNSTADSQAVDTLLCKDSEFTAQVVTGTSSEVTLTYSDLVLGRYYFICYSDSGNPQYVSAWEGSEFVMQTFYYQTGGRGIWFYRTDNNEIVVQSNLWVNQKYDSTTTEPYGQIRGTVIIQPGSSLTIKSSTDYKIYWNYYYPAPKEKIGDYLARSSVDSSHSTTTTEKIVYPISSLNRTATTLIKIIQLPYCPINYYVNSNGTYVFDKLVTVSNTAAELSGNFLVLDNKEFNKSIINEDVDNPLYEVTKEQDFVISDLEAAKDPKYETKQYHSDFYKPKVVYDSFSFAFELENLNEDSEQEEKLSMLFKPTNAFASAFLLTFPTYDTKAKLQDYDNVMFVNRNNELPIYSNDYLNYIKTGYNYEVKNKERQETINWLTTGLQIAGAVVTTAIGAATGNAFGVAAGISLGVSSTISIANAINTTVSNEKALQNKMERLRAQSTSVSSCDNVDLMNEYCIKPKLMIYKPREETWRNIYNLLYYCGYATNQFKIPEFNTRYWFNYIQCTPEFDTSVQSPYNKFIDDIKVRYQAGVTVYHHHDTWDWNQQNENWENNLVELPILKNVRIEEDEQLTSSVDFDYYGPTLDGVNTYIEIRTLKTSVLMDEIITSGMTITRGNHYSFQIEDDQHLTQEWSIQYRVTNTLHPEQSTGWINKPYPWDN